MQTVGCYFLCRGRAHFNVASGSGQSDPTYALLHVMHVSL